MTLYATKKWNQLVQQAQGYLINVRKRGCLENSDLENSDLRPEKLRPSGCLENSDPKDKTNLDSECQRMLQAVLFTVRRYLNVQRK